MKSQEVCSLLNGQSPMSSKKFWLIILPFLSGIAQAQFTFSTNNGALTITAYTGAGGGVVVPSLTNGLPVISIGPNAFALKTISSVTIPDGISDIQDGAFLSCAQMTNAMLPSTMTNLGVSAFSGCGRLTTMQISQGITTIESSTFRNCASLTSAAIPSTVTNIGAYAFSGCTHLASLTLPNALATIDDYAFQGASVRNFTLPDSISSLGIHAFENCAALTDIAIPRNVSNIPDYAFNRSALTNVTIGAAVTNIGTQAFANTGLSHVVIPEGVINVGISTFAFCGSLNTVIIPGSVTNVGNLAFEYSERLANVFFTENAIGVDSSVFTGDPLVTVYYLPGTTGWGSTVGGVPAVLWNPKMQGIDLSFGTQSNQFGFTVTGNPDIPVVIEAAVMLGASWAQLQSCTLTNGSLQITDAQWTNYPARFYRIRSP